MSLDRKFKINAECIAHGHQYNENNAVLFLAKDKALPNTLRYYYEECYRLGAAQSQLEAIQLLIKRVDEWQHNNPTKVPDVEPELEPGCLEE